jgi:hypothetical protein
MGESKVVLVAAEVVVLVFLGHVRPVAMGQDSPDVLTA